MSSDGIFVFVELLYVNNVCILILHQKEVEDEREREVVRGFFLQPVRKT